MDCLETRTLLTAFHDGELPPDNRARVGEHLSGCPECRAMLADMARADQAAGVPDPGPAYWERFNARVMNRIERDEVVPGGAVLRPKHGWVRHQLRYLVPAVAAAALVVMVVRYGGMQPGPPTMARDGQVPGQAGTPGVLTPRPMARDGQVPGQAGTPGVLTPRPMARDGQVPGQAGTPGVLSPRPAVPPGISEQAAPIPTGDRMAKAEPEFRGGEPPRAGTGRDALGSNASTPAAVSVPSPPPVTAENEVPPRMQAERKKMEGASALLAEQQGAGKATSGDGLKMANDQSAEAPPAVSLGDTRPKAGPYPLASASPRTGSPCEHARTLAERKRFREAEYAQRACLAETMPEPAREKGLVFLAELLDRQARFAEADAVLSETQRLFPESRPLDSYRQQRPMVQKHPLTAPVTR